MSERPAEYIRHRRPAQAATYYRPEDGCTYWRVWGVWIGAPTFQDGTIDEPNAGPIGTLDIEPEELEELTAYLDARLEERHRWRRRMIAQDARRSYKLAQEHGATRGHARRVAVGLIRIRTTELYNAGLGGAI